ncbi:putative quinol monooxygenase [Actinoplanes sp. NPDC051494]|uniref:putative quinol monooxygenase n=1 Tax=Actinoplanes sp. NPDC051494 TaxID=3363907 RepID=UPI0037A51398
MIVEYIRYRTSGTDGDNLIEAYEKAAEPLLASGHCLSYEVSRCVEEPAVLVVRIEWDSAQGHLEGFRKGPEFPAFFALVRPFVQAIEEMRHYEVQTVRAAS